MSAETPAETVRRGAETILRTAGLYDAGLSIGQPTAGFTVDQTSETNATVHYLGSAPDRTMARLERAAQALEADGYTVARLIDDGRYYLDITRHGQPEATAA